MILTADDIYSGLLCTVHSHNIPDNHWAKGEVFIVRHISLPFVAVEHPTLWTKSIDLRLTNLMKITPEYAISLLQGLADGNQSVGNIAMQQRCINFIDDIRSMPTSPIDVPPLEEEFEIPPSLLEPQEDQ